MKEQLNSLVLKYQQTNDEKVFKEIYKLSVAKFHPTFNAIAKSLRASVDEVFALYEDVLLRCIPTYTGEGNFENYFMFSVKNKRANLYRDRKLRTQKEVLECCLPKDDDTSAATLEIISEETPEDTLVRKKRADQRQLIRSLLDQTDETTINIVEAFLSCERPTPTAIGKTLGIHHMTVIRKLEKLARNFDSKQFGDFRDYLIAN
ncbi:hypothetical protein [Bacillus nakamurai]|uniref:hypothetical protein n=1 Tax=Bacillus nakamurai TaxID=1793963 RepID=UPI0020C2D344|nr:hypothetical protein [Bacillus nakamurai]MCP6682945.1 hypothetical protein [Bacillus nakamurai]